MRVPLAVASMCLGLMSPPVIAAPDGHVPPIVEAAPPAAPDPAAKPSATAVPIPAVQAPAPPAAPPSDPQQAPGAPTKPALAKPDAKPKPPPAPIKISQDPRPSFGPDTFMATMRAAERYRAIAEAGGWPVVPNEITRLAKGQSGAAVAALRARLAAEGDLVEQDRAGQAYGDAVAAAVRRFQLRHGLDETGLVGPRTLAQLNVPAEQRLRALQASAARMLGTKFAFGERYVAVNIPSAAVEAIDHGEVRRRYVAVVGKPDRPSPMVETRVTSVNLNPTWTVPVSLIKKDIIPHVRKDPGYLAKMKIRLFDAGGQEVDPATIDWSTERAVNYTVRQDAGVANSLGEIRIDMPNRHAVYMHDTPSKSLFARERRVHSSGCVRVSGVKDLAGWLLAGTPGSAGPSSGWGPMEVETAIAAGRRVDIRLSRPVPVAWVYLTGYATGDGTVHFRDDPYHLDDPAAPPLPPPSPQASPASAARPATPEPVTTSSIGPAR